MTRVSENDRDYLEVEQDLRKRYRKNLWCRFTKAIREYDLVQEGTRSRSASPAVRIPC